MECHSCGWLSDRSQAQVAGQLVASDCQPVHCDLAYIECEKCGLVQKEITPIWTELCDDIYSNYKIYHQAAGNEQKVRGVSGNRFAPRSELLTDFLMRHISDKKNGTLLDIGCGNGAFLSAVNRAFDNWQTSGAERNRAFESDIRGIDPNARFFEVDHLESLQEQFKIVTLIHCLEHIPSPVAYLRGTRRLVQEDGFLLIQVPDTELNPFDLLIADHASHFSKSTLALTVGRAGFEVIACGNLVLGKEITLLARPQGHNVVGDCAASVPFLGRNLSWLQSIRRQTKNLIRSEVFGIFGSSIAGSWLASEFRSSVSFFVDEDSKRVGNRHMEIPIISPLEIPSGATVYVALEPDLAGKIGDRILREDFTVVVPPRIDLSTS